MEGVRWGLRSMNFMIFLRVCMCLSCCMKRERGNVSRLTGLWCYWNTEEKHSVGTREGRQQFCSVPSPPSVSTFPLGILLPLCQMPNCPLLLIHNTILVLLHFLNRLWYNHAERETGMETETQTQTNRQETDGETDWQTVTETDRPTDKQKKKERKEDWKEREKITIPKLTKIRTKGIETNH